MHYNALKNVRIFNVFSSSANLYVSVDSLAGVPSGEFVESATIYVEGQISADVLERLKAQIKSLHEALSTIRFPYV
jgi:hypothetical protein